MNVKKLEASIKTLQENLAGGLVRADVWKAGTGQSIAGINSNPKGVALFEAVTAQIIKSLAAGGYSELNDFFLIDLKNNSMLVVVFVEDYLWSIEVNKEKTNMGLLLSIAIPETKAAFKEAISG